MQSKAAMDRCAVTNLKATATNDGESPGELVCGSSEELSDVNLNANSKYSRRTYR